MFARQVGQRRRAGLTCQRRQVPAARLAPRARSCPAPRHAARLSNGNQTPQRRPTARTPRREKGTRRGPKAPHGQRQPDARPGFAPGGQGAGVRGPLPGFVGRPRTTVWLTTVCKHFRRGLRAPGRNQRREVGSGAGGKRPAPGGSTAPGRPGQVRRRGRERKIRRGFGFSGGGARSASGARPPLPFPACSGKGSGPEDPTALRGPLAAPATPRRLPWSNTASSHDGQPPTVGSMPGSHAGLRAVAGSIGCRSGRSSRRGRCRSGRAARRMRWRGSGAPRRGGGGLWKGSVGRAAPAKRALTSPV